MWFWGKCNQCEIPKFSAHFTVAVASATLCLLTVNPANAAFECNDESWQGTDGLYALARQVAGAGRVRLVASLDYGKLAPDDSVLIIHPMVTLDATSLTAFLQAGGRVALLDDFGTAEPFLERFGIRRLTAPQNPTETLRGNVHLPIATPVDNSTGAQGPQRHPIAKDVERVVLNHPSAFANPGLTAILEVRTKNGSALPVAITGVVGKERPGRLFALSDPSAVMNLMLRFPGNRNFASALVRYLAVDEGRAEKGQLYIVANQFDQTGNFGGGIGPIADAKNAIEQLIGELRRGLSPTLLVLLVALTLLGVARWIYRNAFRAAAPAIPRFLRPVPLSIQAGWPGRAAALLLSSTHPVYVALELRAAFRLHLSRLVEADPGIHSNALLSIVQQKRLLEASPLAALKQYLAELDAIEQAVSARRSVRIRPPTLKRLLEQGLDILEHISQVEPNSREPSPTS